MKLDSRVFIAVAAVAGIALAAASDMGGSSDEAPSADPPPAASASGAALPEGHPEIPSASSSGLTLSGEVRETLEGSGYTYVRLATDGGEIWAAGPVTELPAGETVTLVGAMDMGAFSSLSLERSFDRLYFADRFVVGDEPAGAPPAAPAVGTPTGDFRGTVKQAIPVSRYVYLEVETEAGPIWLAAPETEVGEGDEIRWSGGTLMRDFASSTLERTFEAILFVTGLDVVEGRGAG